MVLPGGGAFRAETWSLYAVGMLVIGLRLTARVRKRGYSKLQTDDYLALNLIIWYTLLIVALNEVFFSGGSNFMTPEEEAALTPETIAERVVGSKWVLVVEEAMVLTVWTCKLGMLFLYRRITQGLKQSKAINVCFGWVGAGFIGTQLGLFLNCRPFAEYWAVPTARTQCWSYFNYQIIEASFNISSDLLMLVVAVPIIYKLQVPLLQRAILLTIFGMGIFIIAAAILTKLYSLYPPLLTYAYLNWYCREASVCVYVTNLPAIWTLILDVFPGLRSWGRNTKNPSSSNSKGGGGGSHSHHLHSRGMRTPAKEYQLQQFGRLPSQPGTPGIPPTESQEYIVGTAKSTNGVGDHHEARGGKGGAGGLHINRDVTFTVRRESASDDDDSAAGGGGGGLPHHGQGGLHRDRDIEKGGMEMQNGRYVSNCSAV